MFGSAKPATGFGAAPATGFGAAPATATTGGGFGAAPPAAGGFGASPAATGGFGAPQAGGFGAKPATTGFGGTTGFGAQPATTGFGAQPATTGFGAPQTGGFGAATTGFGAQPAATGFGAPQAGYGAQPAAPAPSVINLQDFTRQSALASYLMELDHAYNALSPKCRFRTFVYNHCGPGQVIDAIQRERYIAFLNGGGCAEEEWMKAQQSNPQPERMYPSPLHFSQELQQRGAKQKEEFKELIKLVDGYLQDVDAVVALDKANQNTMSRLKQEGVMLQRRWFVILEKIEVIRRLGQQSSEASLLVQQVDKMRVSTASPAKLRGRLQELQPYLDNELAASSSQSSSSGPDQQPLLLASVDPATMKGWLQFSGQMQDSIEDLHDLLDRDYKMMVSIRERITAASGY